MSRVVVVEATDARGIAIARDLFVEYQADIGVDLCFQGFAAELAGLPGDYAAPRGRLLLAFVDDQPSGCVALRPFAAASAGAGDTAEMKRLYVRPGARADGLGRRLALAIIGAARDLGYRSMRLDTLPSMTGAIVLYRDLGFREIPPDAASSVAGTLYFELLLP